MSVLCSACRKNDVLENTTAIENKKTFEYKIEEHVLPNADINLITQKGEWVQELDSKMHEDRIYRLAQLWGIDPVYNTEMDLGYFLQVSEYPFVGWINYEVPFLNLEGTYKAIDIRHGYYS